MKIIAHRGAASLAPENSLEGIEAARRLSIAAIEIDVRLSSDGQFVLCHDASLRRLARSPTKIASKTLKQLKNIRLSSGAHLIDLGQAIKAAGETPLVIDAKGKNWAKQLISVLSSYPTSKFRYVVSFNLAELKLFKDLCPDIAVCGGAHINILKTIRRAKRLNFEGVCMPYLGLNSLSHGLAKKGHLEVGVYTVNSRLIAGRLHKKYPEVAITTDVPQKFTN